MIATEDTAEILTQEGESGLDTVGFSGANTLDIQKRRGRPTSTTFFFNTTVTPAIQNVYPLPVAYWGNFITLFDGTIVGGTRLDGQGIGWANTVGSPFLSKADGVSGNTGIPASATIPPTYTFNTVGLKGSNAGIDIFFRTSMTSVSVTLRRVDLTLSVVNTPIVVGGVPQIGNLVPGVITTRRRPEGYISGEDGVQIFFRPQICGSVVPPGFVDPATVGLLSSPLVDVFGNVRLIMNLTP